MKIMLIDPPDTGAAFGEISKKMRPFTPSLGIAYIAAVLEKNNIQFKLLDTKGYGMSLEEIKTEVRKYNPNIVGISCMTVSFGMSLEIARMIKSISNETTIVLGGPHVTPTAEDILIKHACIDITVIGEGEQTMLELAKGKSLDTIKGIAFRKDGKVQINEARPLIEDLDTLPYPARHLFNFENYSQPLYELYGAPIATVLAGRGCPFDCSFCSSKVTFTRKTRNRSIENIMAEIDHLIDTYNTKCIYFVDETLTVNKERIFKLCNEMKKRNIPWIANSRVETLSRETLVMLKESNCKLLQFGIESGDPDVQMQLKKVNNLEKARQVFKWTHELKIDTAAYFIYGAPKETKETVKNTIEFVKQINPTYAHFFVLSPYPGTEIYEYMNNNGMMNVDDWSKVTSPKYDNFIINHPNFSNEELKAIQKNSYRQFYFNINRIFLLIGQLTNWQKIKRIFKLASMTLTFTKKN
jgi:radical SAM superfamily enzyme YgiQ (UPF0313 family)